LNIEEISILAESFRKFDKENVGKISLENFKKVLLEEGFYDP
jgi:Ca2+-binding EF-hand superfamily protein